MYNTEIPGQEHHLDCEPWEHSTTSLRKAGIYSKACSNVMNLAIVGSVPITGLKAGWISNNCGDLDDYSSDGAVQHFKRAYCRCSYPRSRRHPKHLYLRCCPLLSNSYTKWDSNSRPFGLEPESSALDQLGHPCERVDELSTLIQCNKASDDRLIYMFPVDWTKKSLCIESRCQLTLSAFPVVTAAFIKQLLNPNRISNIRIDANNRKRRPCNTNVQV